MHEIQLSLATGNGFTPDDIEIRRKSLFKPLSVVVRKYIFSGLQQTDDLAI
jgi:hypothetical protein